MKASGSVVLTSVVVLAIGAVFSPRVDAEQRAELDADGVYHFIR